MNRTAFRHPLRRGLASLALLSLSSAGLAVGLAPAGYAAGDPAQRYYSYTATATGLDTSFMSDSSDVNLRFGYVQNFGSMNDIDLYAEHYATASNTDAYGRYPGVDTEDLTAWASVQASNEYEFGRWTPYEESTAGGSVAGAFSIGQSVSMVDPQAGIDQDHCVPEGGILSEAEASTRDVNLDELTYGSDVVDVVNLDGPVTTRSETRMVSNGGEHTRGLSTVVEGAAGQYTFNDDSLTVNVVSGARIVAVADGVNPSTALITPAVVEATDAAGVTNVLAPGSVTTFANPANPRVAVTIEVPAGPSSEEVTLDGTEVSAATNAFRAELHVDGRDNMGTNYADAGSVYAQATVPVGGVDCTPPPDSDSDGLADPNEERRGTDPTNPDTDGDGVSDGDEVRVNYTDPLVADGVGDQDSDRDGLSDAREARIGTDPHNPDTDRDGLKDGREVNGITTKRLDDVRTNPLKADTDGDRLRDGVEVRGYTNKRYDRTFRSHPRRVDTDWDGLRDKVEVTGSRNGKFGYEPTSPYRRDTDRGGVADKREIRLGSNPADINSGPLNP